ncbi:MAG: PHP domain-containing protein [Candidatus Limiplasma sp.]|nr:PHP domain-containing protein [Candidatus Limiplasma sp.]MEA5145355.1 PHP domain-containing protein [Candidatus Limiplasma sp.]
MKFLSNAHTHTTFCDGRSTIGEQIAAAQRLGFVSLGFSGHAMQGFDWAYCMSPDAQAAYYASLRGAQAALRAAGALLTLHVGLEQDALVPDDSKAQNRRVYDYLIGSTHYFPEPLDGAWVAVDGSPDLLLRCIRERFHGDAIAMAEAYYAIHGDSIRRDKPDIIGHFDLVRKYAGQLGLDTNAPAYRRAALAALEKVREGCAVLEVNTGNIARGYDTMPYPAPFLLEAWRAMGGDVTLTSDCHNAAQLDCAFTQTMAMLKDGGFDRVLRLGTGASLWEAVAL